MSLIKRKLNFKKVISRTVLLTLMATMLPLMPITKDKVQAAAPSKMFQNFDNPGNNGKYGIIGTGAQSTAVATNEDVVDSSSIKSAKLVCANYGSNGYWDLSQYGFTIEPQDDAKVSGTNYFDASNYTSLVFYVKEMGDGGHTINMSISDDKASWSPTSNITTISNQWVKVVVPLDKSKLDFSRITKINLGMYWGYGKIYYFDNIYFAGELPYASPTMYQDFEAGDGVTPGSNVTAVSSNDVPSTSGVKSIDITANGTVSASNKSYVNISPFGSYGLINGSIYNYLNFYIKDIRGNNPVNVTFTDIDNKTFTVATATNTVQNTWTKLSVPIIDSQDAPLASRIKSEAIKNISIEVSTPGEFKLDDMFFSSQTTDAPPAASTPGTGGWFQSFDAGAITVSAGNNATGVIVTDSANPGGSQAARLTVATSGMPDESNRFVSIKAQGASSVVDASKFNYLSFYVKDTAGKNTVWVDFVDKNNNSVAASTWAGTSIVNQGYWSKVYVSLEGLANKGLDLTAIKEIRLGEYNAGTYYFDDLFFTKNITDEIPSSYNAEVSTYSIPTGIKKVACIGDSYTYGANQPQRGITSWPSQLQTMLGSNYLVKNFGVSGTTMAKSGDNPYWNTASFANSKAFVPDIVIIALGGNDSKNVNWSDTNNKPNYAADYQQDYEDMINTYKSLNPNVKVFACLTSFAYGSYDPTGTLQPPVYAPWGINPDIIQNAQLQRIRDAAAATGAAVIDLNTITQGMQNDYYDNVHPKPIVDTIVAKAIATPILDIAGSAANVGNTSICTWKDNKASAYSITYDDAMYTSQMKFETLLQKYGFRASLAIVSSWVDSSETNSSHPNGTWDLWKAALDRGYFDVISHTNTHVPMTSLTPAQMDQEYQTSIDEIFNKTGHKVEAMALPNSLNNDQVMAESSKYFVATRQSGYGAGFNGSFDNNPINSASTTDYQNIYSSVYQTNTTLQSRNDWLDNGIAKGGWMVATAHGCDGEGYSPPPLSLFDNHYAYLKSRIDSVWNGTFTEVAKYLRERQISTVNVTSNMSTKIKLALTNSLDSNTYNFPLTLKTKVPSDWTNVKVTQGSTIKNVNTTMEGSTNYVYFDAVPNNGDVTLSVDAKITGFVNSVITDSVDQYASYNLPTTVAVNMSDGTTQNVSVTWDKTVDTSKSGVQTFTGTVANYSGTVTLNLTVKPIVTGFFNNLISVTINHNDQYSLPSSVLVIMSDGSTVNTPVIWDKAVDTSKDGVQTFIGTVIGFTQTVTLTLTVNPIITGYVNNTMTDSVNHGQVYTLPAQVMVNMSDGTTKNVNVNWDKAVDTTKDGVQTFTGTVANYSGTVTLTLTVNPIITGYVNSTMTDSVNHGQVYTLPTTVTVKMSDGTTKSVNVTWDKTVDTTKDGVQTFTGSVVGYSQTVKLNLTVIPNSVWFQNFDSGVGIWGSGSASPFTYDTSNTLNPGSTKCAKLSTNSTTASAWDPNTIGLWLSLKSTPSSQPAKTDPTTWFDASAYNYLIFYVKDMGGSKNNVLVRLVDNQDHYIDAGSPYVTVQGQWAKVVFPIDKSLTDKTSGNVPLDYSKIYKIKLGEYWGGGNVYYFDDVYFAKNPTDPAPQYITGYTNGNSMTASVNHGDAYTLPTQVMVNMNDGTTSNVNVTWDKTADTSKDGVQTFTGTVAGFTQTVTLTLTVKPIITGFVNGAMTAKVNHNDNYKLPTTITVKMSDGTTQDVAVTWDKTVDTSRDGVQTFTGTVANYSGAVTLTLTVNPIITGFVNETMTASVNQNGTYKLPTTVAVKMSDGTTQDVAVTWDNNVNTTTVGVQTFTGTIANYSGTVTLTLTVKPIITSYVNSTMTATVKHGEAFDLPATVAVNMSDGTTQNVAVTWDKAVDTTKDGMQTFTGTVANYSGTVTLTLTVKPIITSYVNSTMTATVKHGEAFDLPATVAVNMSDGSTQDVAVTWDKTVDTTKDGVLTFIGIVANFNKTVTLNLTVNPIIKEFLNSTMSAAVNHGEAYTLPTTIIVIMSDGSLIDTPVIWDKAPDTSKDGVQTFIGSVIGFKQKVTLTLTVNPIITGFVNATMTASVNHNDTYKLPTTVTVKMSDDTTQDAAVTWDKTVDTTKDGVQTFTGTVANYSGAVTLTLTVNSIITGFVNETMTASVNQNGSYKLPTTVAVKMSDGTTQDAAVTWDINTVDTTIFGVQTFTGTVANYSGTVTLTLTVKPIITGYVNSAITAAVNHGETFNLPATAAVNMSDGTTQNVAVTWDKAADTTKDGVQTFTGTVANFDKTILLTLTVKSIITGYVNSTITAAVNHGETFNLPATVTVNVSDGTTQNVAVTWDKTVDTTKDGVQTFTGTVANYSGTVTLTLTVNPIITGLANSAMTASVDKDGSFALPVTVKVVTSDGKTTDASVTWDKTADTSTVGVQSFKGTIAGLDQKVTLTLTVKEKTAELNLNDGKDKVNTAITESTDSQVIISTSENATVDSTIFSTIKDNNKTAVFEQKSEDGTLLSSWTFSGSDITGDIKDVNLGISFGAKDEGKIKEKVKDYDVLTLQFSHDGTLPGKAVVKLKVDSTWLQGKDKNNIYLYYYNPQTNKTELIANGLKVDENGYIQFTLAHCSEYFLVDKDLVAAGILPKTGSMVDENIIVFLGISLVLMGAALVLFKRRRN